MTSGPGVPLSTQEQWRHVRRHLNAHRHELALLATELYPSSWRIAGSPLLARREWIAPAPIALEHVQITWCDSPHRRGVTGHEVAWRSTLPLRGDGRRFASYAQALAQLDPPQLLENRAAYRLLHVEPRDADAELRFTRGSYFDVIDICEAVAHELAASVLASDHGGAAPAMRHLPLRASIDDPTDLARRPVIPAISVLTLRREGPNAATCLLHWRDAAKVASGGGLYQVAPVGLFQPSSDTTFNEANDFDLWRSIARELSEELLGASEDYNSDHQPIDYERWPFHTTLAAARREGALRVFWLGLGIDPLTLVADLLVVAVFDAELFDTVFPRLASTNAEGHLVRLHDETGATTGVPFTAPTVERFTTGEPMQPAGAALLRVAWRHRDTLLGAG
jgi:hypothetical protein